MENGRQPTVIVAFESIVSPSETKNDPILNIVTSKCTRRFGKSMMFQQLWMQLLYVLFSWAVFLEVTTAFIPLYGFLRGSFSKQHVWGAKNLQRPAAANILQDDNPSNHTRSWPIMARREEDRVVYAGIGLTNGNLPRQAQDSKEVLMDPPLSVKDPYGWMRDDSRTNQEVIQYIDEENKYTQQCTQSLKDLQQKLQQEYESFTPNDDISQIFLSGKYYYYSRRVLDQPYPIRCRIPVERNDSQSFQNLAEIQKIEEVILDENIVAKELGAVSYFTLHSVVPSPSHQQVAFSVDTKGDEVYSIYVRNLNTRHDTKIASNSSGTVVWGIDDESLYFVCIDAALCRPHHWMEWRSDRSLKIIKEETDERFWGDLRKSMDGKYLFWTVECSNSQSETWALDLSLSEHKIQCIACRSNNFWYTVEHRCEYWWILSNHEASCVVRLYTTQVANSENISEWELVDWVDSINPNARNADLSLQSVIVFPQHVVVQGRNDGLPRVWILQLGHDNISVQNVKELSFEEPAHYISLARAQDYSSSRVMVSFETMVTPPQSMLIDLRHPSKRQVLHTQEITGYIKEQYKCDRLEIPCGDGKTTIPVSVVYRKGAMESRPHPVHLIGYGAYGHSLEASFSTLRLSLLNRGCMCVVAHVRGGGEKGRQWYEWGKGLNKLNSIHDFVQVARWLVETEWTTPNMLSCEGRSAGGLLAAAAINQEPSLFRVAILGVPFLDPLITMIDPSLPLTALEWNEWGNPNEFIHFENIHRYSPLQNIQPNQTYPSTMLIGGFYDPRVQYWEPLKFAATLRYSTASKVDRPVCVKIDTNAGHSFGSNRAKYFEELAFNYAFMLDQLGLRS